MSGLSVEKIWRYAAKHIAGDNTFYFLLQDESSWLELTAGQEDDKTKDQEGSRPWGAMAYSSYSNLSRAQLTFEYLHTNS